ncbi:hypothetical protein D3C71_1548710 [compost metagenome]
MQAIRDAPLGVCVAAVVTLKRFAAIPGGNVELKPSSESRFKNAESQRTGTIYLCVTAHLVLDVESHGLFVVLDIVQGEVVTDLDSIVH